MTATQRIHPIIYWSSALSAVALALSTHASAAPPPPAPGDETAWFADNDQAMTQMMNAMSIAPLGDVDQDFVASMVPHHQGAIDMAQAELRYGHNEKLRRIAQEIIVEQQQEIIAMRLAAGLPLPDSSAAPDQITPAAPASAPHVMHHPSATTPHQE